MTRVAAPVLAAERPTGLPWSPYVGPRPFEKNEEHLFFGRDREARDLISLIIANRIFVLYSQSGAGKSSLLNTKIISGLEREQCRVLPIARVQGKIPATVSEFDVKNIFSLNAIMSLRDCIPDLETEELLGLSFTDFIGRLYVADSEEPLVLIFDQFEELFSFYEYRWRDRVRFIREVVAALEKLPELKVVFSLREDYIAKLDALSGEFPNKLRARYHLERLQEAAAIEAIANPAETSDRRYDKGVPEAVVQDLLATQSRDIQGNLVSVPGEFIEPVQLQVVCSNLWSSVPESEKLITRDHLEQSGMVDEALRKFYEASLVEIASGAHVSELEIRRWIERALITSAGTRGTVFRDVTETAGMPNKVVDALENRHLIRADWRAGAQWYEITHDRLLRPIRESNRVRLEKASRNSWLKVGGVGAAFALCVFTALGWSLNSNREAARRADAQKLASSLVAASSRLPQNDIDLALLLSVEAFRTEDSMSTRSNLLSQVLRADRIERIVRVYRRDVFSSVMIPGTDLFASITADRSLILWNRSGRALSTYALNGEGPFNLFTDRSRLYAIPNRGESQLFDVKQDGTLQGVTANDDLLLQLKKALEGQDLTPIATSADSILSVQRDPDVRRTMAFAAGRLLTVRRDEIVVMNVRDRSELARLLVASGSTEAKPTAKVLDVGLSLDGKLGFALICSLSDTKSEKSQEKAPSLPSQTLPSAGESPCVRRATKVWQVDTGRELSLSPSPSFRFDGDQVIAIGSSDGRVFIATGKSDGNVVVTGYEIHDDRTRVVVEISISAPVPLADMLFTENCESLVSISGGQATLWRLSAPRRLQHRLSDGIPNDIAVSVDRHLAAVRSDGYFVESADTRQTLLTGTNAPPADWVEIDTSLAGVSLAGGKFLVSQYGKIDLFDINSGRKISSINIGPAATASVAMDPLGQYIASGFLPLSFRRFDAGNAAVATDYSRVPVMWTVDSREPSLLVDLRSPARAKSGTNDQTPGADDKVQEETPGAPQLIIGVAFSPDGQNFVLARSGGIRSGGTIEVYKRQKLGEPFVKSSTVAADSGTFFATFSRDGKLLAVSQGDGDILLIDVATTTRLGRLPSTSREGGGRIAISSDGRMLAMANIDGGVVVWDIATRTQFGRPVQIGKLIEPTGIAFSRDDRQLFFADANLKSMVAFDLSVEAWIAQACDVARRELSEQERLNYSLPASTLRTCD